MKDTKSEIGRLTDSVGTLEMLDLSDDKIDLARSTKVLNSAMEFELIKDVASLEIGPYFYYSTVCFSLFNNSTIARVSCLQYSNRCLRQVERSSAEVSGSQSFR